MSSSCSNRSYFPFASRIQKLKLSFAPNVFRMPEVTDTRVTDADNESDVLSAEQLSEMKISNS